MTATPSSPTPSPTMLAHRAHRLIARHRPRGVGGAMRWVVTGRCDPAAAALADRHYSRRAVGSRHFVPPGKPLVLLSQCQRAVWVSHISRYIKHDWKPCWGNPIFRNEGAGLSSDLIRSALAVTRTHWGDPPGRGAW